ncbi:MAG: protein kinase [Deltaproteobacteria bacterium]|nr:protein kinase [Deltaproteobacteria bacterium]
MNCPSCQAPHEVGTNFCGHCGSDLRRQSIPTVNLKGRSTMPLAASDAAESAGVDPWLGRLIDSRYRVLARLGQGGMGIVYKVEHQRMGKIAAMKVLHRELADDKEVVKRFRREAEAVSRLNHPNTVQTFDFGTCDGAMYLVMEYVRGEDLGNILRRDGPLPFSRAAPIFLQACGALAEAHDTGIVHRDLKPENILVTRTKEGQDHVKVLDFGLAKLSERDEALDVTTRGTIVGTPYYMSPEQIRGEELDHRTDIYSFGATMYRVLTGEPPFQAQAPIGVLTKHLTEEVTPLRLRTPGLEIDSRVEALVLRAMAKQRENRFPTVDSLREELESLRVDLLGSSPKVERRPSSQGGAVGPSHTPVRIESSPDRRGKEDTTAGVPRLSREDFDEFERSLKHRALVRLVAIPLVLGAVGAGVFFYLRQQGRRPQAAEKEPNNELQNATRIAPGTPVRGKLGQRIDATTSDRDYYRIAAIQGSGRQCLRARVSSIRNMDLSLAVYDVTGKLLAHADNGVQGDVEVVPNLGVDEGDIYLAVLESKRALAARGPTENVTDEYELSVELAAPAPGEELEPNDLDSDATPIGAGIQVVGYLGRFRDVDRYRFQGNQGNYSIEVTGADSASIGIRLDRGALVAGRKRDATLENGVIVGVERDDPEFAESRSLPAIDQPYTIIIRPMR